MPRIFYTERDIEDLARRGVKEVELNDDVYLTDLARERMDSLGIKARQPGSPAQAAPAGSPSAVSGPLSDGEKNQVIDKVKSAVIARLGPGVDAGLVDQVVRRVVNRL